MKPLPARRKKTEMDVSYSIVSIVFLLMFFFLLTGQMQNTAAQRMALAETSDLPLDRLPSPILIVGEGGAWSLDGAPVAPDLLTLALQRLPQPVILHVLIGKEAPAESLLQVVTRPDLANIEMRLVTLRRTGP
ncbi:MAG: biopolymer transporter ExbD [Paracoccaceae bacterium]